MKIKSVLKKATIIGATALMITVPAFAGHGPGNGTGNGGNGPGDGTGNGPGDCSITQSVIHSPILARGGNGKGGHGPGDGTGNGGNGPGDGSGNGPGTGDCPNA
ncbi:Merozoite surface antigen 2 (fragment) [Desulfamplus magnetovallimortis]|uniref:Merozoite surface antigen 2 n=1 Tax=Desulfamplus magnetovallimortis TaxID=1246637 RepID=A0A1W1HHU5_9BACT